MKLGLKLEMKWIIERKILSNFKKPSNIRSVHLPQSFPVLLLFQKLFQKFIYNSCKTFLSVKKFSFCVFPSKNEKKKQKYVNKDIFPRTWQKTLCLKHTHRIKTNGENVVKFFIQDLFSSIHLSDKRK